jgi:uncharacterized cofD-like protein
MKNVVVFGGGTGLSHILKGLKLFPINVTAIISVSDNGSSTGILKREMNMPAIGDIATVMISMANTNKDVEDLLKYRFKQNTSLDNHPIKNLLLAALYDIKGNLADAIKIMCTILNIKGTILPISDDKIELVGIYDDGTKIVGEEQITKLGKKVKELTYNKKIKVNKEVFKAIEEADLIVFSPGSLYTSILPHLIIEEVRDAINQSKAPKLYISNLFTQPGETDHFTVSDHLKILKKYVNIDAVIANGAKMPKKELKRYETTEQKDAVKLDKKKINSMGIKVIDDEIFTLENNIIRHDALKTAYLIFSYLMSEESK